MSEEPPIDSLQLDGLVKRFEVARPTYEAFTNNVAQLVVTLMKSRGIEYLAVEPRTKSIQSFQDKVQRPTKQGKYDCIEAVTDLSGLRVITYYQKDVLAICKIIEQNF